MTPLPALRPVLGCFLASGALVAATLTVFAPPAGAAPGAGDVTATYQALGSTLGAIPDGPDTGNTCSTTAPGVREVQIPVSGVSPGPITDVRVRVALEHDKVGDIGLQLVAPDGTTVPVIDRIGADRVGCGDDSGFNGNFAFFDGAPGNLAAFAAANGPDFDITSGNFFPSTAGGSPIALTAAFANVNANGTWKLRVLDYQAGVVGRVYSANIFIAHVDQARQCRQAAQVAASSAKYTKRLSSRLRDLRSGLSRAKKRGASKAQVAAARERVAKTKRNLALQKVRSAQAKTAQAAACA